MEVQVPPLSLIDKETLTIYKPQGIPLMSKFVYQENNLRLYLTFDMLHHTWDLKSPGLLIKESMVKAFTFVG